MAITDLHPSISKSANAIDFTSGELKCKCSDNPVEVVISGKAAHNHLCACSVCWKPEGALFSQIAVVAKDQLRVLKNENKLKIVNENAAIQRHACKDCGVHMVGKVTDPDHHYYGIDFVHLELAHQGSAKIEFAGYVSSLVEAGIEIDQMDEIRKTLVENGIPCYDTMSPEILDVIAYHQRKIA